MVNIETKYAGLTLRNPIIIGSSGLTNNAEQNKKLAKRIKCVTVDDLMTNEEVHKRSEAILTINGGFFDPNNKKTISYVTTDGHNSADPLFNESLFADPILRKNLDKIINIESN